MNTHTLTLPLWPSSKTELAKSRDWRSYHRYLVVDGNVAYHWMHNADKPVKWKAERRWNGGCCMARWHFAWEWDARGMIVELSNKILLNLAPLHHPMASRSTRVNGGCRLRRAGGGASGLVGCHVARVRCHCLSLCTLKCSLALELQSWASSW